MTITTNDAYYVKTISGCLEALKTLDDTKKQALERLARIDESIRQEEKQLLSVIYEYEMEYGEALKVEEAA
jgi:hypothetical protein